MTDEEIAQRAVKHAVANSRDSRTRRWLMITRIGMVGFVLVLGVLVALLFIRQEARDKSAMELVEQVLADCDKGKVKASICTKAEDVEKDVQSTPVPVPGLPGADGRPGPKGEKGDKGDPGRPGPKGDKGDTGDAGQPGAGGAAGTPGLNGLSAYEVATTQGFTGTIDEWLASLKGAKGDTGDKGDMGSPGQPGEDAWPFNFVFTFETRTGRVYDCPIEIGEDGQQINQATCTAREGEPDVQPAE